MRGLAVRCLPTPFFPRSGGMPGGADARRVGVPLLPVDQPAGVGLDTQRWRSARILLSAAEPSATEPGGAEPGVAYQMVHLSGPLLGTLPQPAAAA